MQDIKSNPSKFWDTIDNIDRYLYGRKMKNFLIGSIAVLVIAPILDWILEVPYDRLTWLATFSLMLYVLLIILTWINAWRDDNGKWTFQRAKSRLITYYQTFRDTIATAQKNSRHENLYRLGFGAFFAGLGWKSLQNLSVFVRKPIQKITGHTMIKFIHFEKITRNWYWVPILLSFIIMYYLWRTDRKIMKRVKDDLLSLFGNSRYRRSAQAIKITNDELVIDATREDQVGLIVSNSKSTLFNDFVNALKVWQPGNCVNEYEYQDKLYRHLKHHLPASEIATEYPIGDKANGNKGRADLVIDDTILIEMKRDTSAGAVQRAQGQIGQYSGIWSGRGPVILLLCSYQYDYAKLKFSSTMMDMQRLERPVLTVVAAN